MVDVVGGKRAAPRGVTSYIRREVLTVPNALTMFRFIAGIMIFVWVENLPLVFTLVFFGTLSDGLDGFLARLLKQETSFGRTLDQVTDFVFGFALMYAIYRIEGPTWYNVPVGVTIGVFAFGMMYLRGTGWSVNSSSISKLRIALQFTAAIVIIAAYAFPKKDSGILVLLGYVGLWYSMYLMWKSFIGYWRKPD